jgi:hypothetical protein
MNVEPNILFVFMEDVPFVGMMLALMTYSKRL